VNLDLFLYLRYWKLEKEFLKVFLVSAQYLPIPIPGGVGSLYFNSYKRTLKIVIKVPYSFL